MTLGRGREGGRSEKLSVQTHHPLLTSTCQRSLPAPGAEGRGGRAAQGMERTREEEQASWRRAGRTEDAPITATLGGAHCPVTGVSRGHGVHERQWKCARLPVRDGTHTQRVGACPERPKGRGWASGLAGSLGLSTQRTGPQAHRRQVWALLPAHISY